MGNFLNVFVQRLVAATVALAMTGLLAWSVIDSTSIGPSDHISVSDQA